MDTFAGRMSGIIALAKLHFRHFLTNSLLFFENHLPCGFLLSAGFSFPIDEELTSPATRVMFNNGNHIKQKICLKMWLECSNGVYNTGDLSKRTEFLLEGLQFNRSLAPDIHLGIVPIIAEKASEKKLIQCGPLIRDPENQALDINRPYALVMKRLRKEWCLDHQLYTGGLGNELGMERLARQIAKMHQQLATSSIEYGTPERILSKLDLNRKLFEECLQKDSVNLDFSKQEISICKAAGNLLVQLGRTLQQDFENRHRDGRIRRCHGDLKATNLWLLPSDIASSKLLELQWRLVPLDCVDFNPEFYNIDTLSDVAMLAVDLEMRIGHFSKNEKVNSSEKQLAQHFLKTYLHAVGEDNSVWPLLEYYITEKAMVCAYMSILYDSMPTQGEKYLEVVMAHSQNLSTYLPQKISRKITKPIQLTTVAANQHA